MVVLVDAGDVFADLRDTFNDKLKTITYRRGDVEVSGIAAIQLDVKADDEDIPSVEYTTRWYIPLRDIADTFGTPQQRDEIVVDGVSWVVVERTHITPANACEVLCVRDDKVRVWP